MQEGEGAAKPKPEAPIWLQRGSASASESWTSTALVRRKHGTHTRTDLLVKRQHGTRLNAMMPKRNSESFAELVEPKVLHKYLNQSRSSAGLPPLYTKVEQLISPRRGRTLRMTQSAATL